MDTIPQEVLSNIVGYLDSRSIIKIATSFRGAVGEDIRKLSEDNIFWKHRVATLLKKNIPDYIHLNWREVYTKLSNSDRQNYFLVAAKYGYTELIDLIYPVNMNLEKLAEGRLIAADRGHASFVNYITEKAGLKNRDNIDDVLKLLEHSTYAGSIELTSYILSNKLLDGQVIPAYILYTAIHQKHSDIVELLLDDERVDTSGNELMFGFGKENPLETAMKTESFGIFKLLLASGRIDPCENDCYLLTVAVGKTDYNEYLKLLLADPRVNPARNNIAIREAYRNNNVQAVKLLSGSR